MATAHRLIFLGALLVLALACSGSTLDSTTSACGNNTNGTNLSGTNGTGTNCSNDLPPNIDANTWLWINRGTLIAAILVGLIWCFAGYRVLRVTLFLAGFILLYFVSFSLLSSFPQVTDVLRPWVIMAISAGIGLLGGILVVVVFKIGVFIMGFIFGAILAIVVISFTPLQGVINANIQSNVTVYVFFGSVVGLGIIVGILAIIFIKFIVVIVTACNGSFVIMSSIDKLAPSFGIFQILSGVFQRNNTVPTNTLDWTSYQTYVVLGGLVLLAIAGIAIQFRFTARGHHHDDKDRKPKEDEYPLLNGIQDV